MTFSVPLERFSRIFTSDKSNSHSPTLSHTTAAQRYGHPTMSQLNPAFAVAQQQATSRKQHAPRYARLAEQAASEYDEERADKYAELALQAYGRVFSERDLREALGQYVATYYAESFFA